MSLLSGLWTTAYVMAGASILTMFAMIGRRVVVDWLARREAVRKKAFTRELLAYLEGGDDTAITLALGRRSARRILPEVARRILRLVRGEDLTRLSSLLRQSGAIKNLIRLSASGRDDERLDAVETLAFLNEPEAMATLEKRLDDRNYDVQVAAALGLANWNKLPPADELAVRLRIETADRLSSYFKIFRAYLTDRADELLPLLSADRPAAVKIVAIDALSESGEFAVLPWLLKLAEDSNLNVRVCAVKGLGRLGHPRARDVVLQSLADPAWEVRAQAAQAVGAIGLKVATPALSLLLEDNKHWWVRYRSAQALGRLGKAGQEALTESATRSADAANFIEAVMFEAGRA